MIKKIEMQDDAGNLLYLHTDSSVVKFGDITVEDKLQGLSKIQKSGGTGTAITLSEVTLEDGYQKTFIVTANNSSAATKINGKNLYKPGGTVAPNLISGKAVTVWYDLAGDCFFIKASAEGDAVADNVLAGKKFSNDDDTGVTGTMVNNGPASAETINLTSNNQEYTIATGFHSGLRKIKAMITNLAASVIKAGTVVGGITGTFTADATALAAQMLAGATAYVNGNKITGIITSKGAVTITPGTTDQTIASGQYLSGNQVVKGDPNLIPSNVANGVSIFGVIGSLVSGKRFASGTLTSSSVLGTINFTYGNGTTGSQYYIAVSGLNFLPSMIIIQGKYDTQIYQTIYMSDHLTTVQDANINMGTYFVTNTAGSTNTLMFKKDGTAAYVNSGGFRLPVMSNMRVATEIIWKAYE